MIVQNDDGLIANANSYLTVAEFVAYHEAGGNTTAAEADQDAIEFALVKATRFVDARFRFVGQKLNGRDQTTQWPRIGAYDRDRDPIDGIPRELKEAVSEYAARIVAGTDLLPDPEQTANGAAIQSKAEKVGPIEESVTYAQGARYELPRYPLADNMLRSAGLVVSGGDLRRG